MKGRLVISVLPLLLLPGWARAQTHTLFINQSRFVQMIAQGRDSGAAISEVVEHILSARGGLPKDKENFTTRSKSHPS